MAILGIYKCCYTSRKDVTYYDREFMSNFVTSIMSLKLHVIFVRCVCVR